MLKEKATVFRRATVAFDIILTCISLFAAIVIYHRVFYSVPPLLGLFYRYTPALYFVLPVWYVLFRINGMYESRRLDTIPKVAWITTWSVGEGIALLILVSYFLRITDLSRLFVMVFGCVNVIFLVFGRVLLKEFLHSLRSKGYNFRRILIVGTGNRARAVAKKLHAHREWGMMVYGFLSQTPEDVGKDLEEGKVIGQLEDLQEIISSNPIDEVHIALPLLNLDTIASLLEICEEQGIQTRVMMDLYSPTISQVHLEDFRGTPMLTFTASPMETWEMVTKETIDRVGAFVMILLLFPLFLFLSTCIKLTSKGPVFFVQERVGLHKRRFRMYKFRTMVPNANQVLDEYLEKNPELRLEWETTFKLQNDPRVTRSGKILRKLSLDELPQLWNVLKGEMSLVGPRPIVDDEIRYYGERYDLYSFVMPGITGLWQVSGRNDTSYEDRVNLDEYYVRNWSIWMDIFILTRTASVVLRRKGAY